MLYLIHISVSKGRHSASALQKFCVLSRRSTPRTPLTNCRGEARTKVPVMPTVAGIVISAPNWTIRIRKDRSHINCSSAYRSHTQTLLEISSARRSVPPISCDILTGTRNRRIVCQVITCGDILAPWADNLFDTHLLKRRRDGHVGIHEGFTLPIS